MYKFNQIKIGMLVLFVFLGGMIAPQIAFGIDVTATDSFLKVVKKIAKRESRDAVVKYITEKDPQAGIIARDLVEKIIEAQTQDEIIRSTVEVVTTMMFLENIQPSINQLIAENPEILKQANAVGWDQSKLAAYSGLYYFFSERLKYNLPVPSEIYTQYKYERTAIEGLTSGKSKWSTVVSRQLTPQKHASKNWYIADVRAVLLFQQMLLNRINGISYTGENLMAETLTKALKIECINTPEALLDEIAKQYINSLKKWNSDIDTQQLSEKLASSAVILPIFQVLIPENIALLGTSNVKEEIVKSVTIVLESWLDDLNKSALVSYHIALSGQYSHVESDLRFSMQDQFRINVFNPSFGFIGGFMDPTLQSATNNKKIPIGIGYQFTDRWAGYLFLDYFLNDLKLGPDLGVGIGYQLKLSDLEL
jgi:hypothetical protein